MARAQGARAQMALAFESTYGTAPASGFTRVPFATSDLDAQQALQENELVGFGRDPLAPVLDAVEVSGDLTVPIDAVAFGFWLKAAFGAPTTTGTTTFTHTFQSGGTSIPSLSIETGLPEVPSYSMVKGAMVNTLGWEMSRSGLLQAKVGLMAQGETTGATSSAGTVTDVALQRFNHFHGGVSRNGSALGDVVSATVEYSNNLEPVEVIRADGLIGGLDLTIASLKGQLVMRLSDRALIEAAVAGTPSSLEVAYQLPAAGPSFNFTAHAIYLSRPRRVIDGPKGVQVTFDWMAAKAASPARMCTAVLTNSRATY